MKRTFDFITSLLGLVIFSPVFMVIGLIIKADDRGSVFFKQKRVGKNGRLFTLYKFRTMRIRSESNEVDFEPGTTSRVTKTGKFIRKKKLDELPQLVNVLKGDMSLVGPRPEVKKWTAVYPERWKNVLSVKPGMTDNSAILFRNEEALLAGSDDPERTYKEIILPQKLDLYENYVSDNSFFGDLKLIFNTIFSILFKK